MVEQAVRIGQLAILHQLVNIGVNRAAGALDAHKNRRHGALGRNSVNALCFNTLQRQSFIKAADGIGIDTGLCKHACFVAQRLRTVTVHHAVRRGVQLIFGRHIIGIGRKRSQAAQAGKHNRCDSEQLGYHPFLHLLNPFLRQIFIRLRAIDDGS